jgi:hypothetical protein
MLIAHSHHVRTVLGGSSANRRVAHPPRYAVNFDNKNVLRVEPVAWPRVNESERIAAVLEAAIPPVVGLADTKCVFPSKVRPEPVFWNAATTASTGSLLPACRLLLVACCQFVGRRPRAENCLCLATPLRDNNILVRHIKPAARKLGLDFVNWQVLRRSFGAWLKIAGTDPKDTQALMRHSRASTTMDIYVQDVPESQRKAVDRLSKMVN